MEDENTPLPADDNPWDDTLKTIKGSIQVTGTPRQIIEGSILGVCIAFFLAILGVTHFDVPLMHTIILFAGAAPCLAFSFMVSTTKRVEKVPGQNMVDSLQSLAYITGSIGQVLFWLGFMSMIAHINSFAFTVLIWSIIVILAVNFFGCIILGGIANLRERKRPTPYKEAE